MSDPIAPAAAEQRKELSRLRSLMVEPGNVYLGRTDKYTWLTDQFVLLDVTGFSVVQGVDDGWYRIVASGANAGLRARSPGLVLDIPNLLKEVRSRDYYPVTPTRISFTDNEAKAFLLVVDISPVVRYRSHNLMPVAMNEDVWGSFRLAWPDAVLSHPGYAGPFRVSVPDGNEELAYIEPIQIPEDLHKISIAVVEACHGNDRDRDGRQ